MARDVEFNVTASDKTGNALTAAERRFKATADRIDKIGKSSGESLGKSALKSIATVAPRLTGTLVKSLESVAGIGGPLLGGMAITAAPVIASTLSGAIIGGAGIGGVLGGVILASRDARVKAAGAALGKNVMGTLTQQSQVFIAPVLQSIDDIGDSFERVSDKTDSIFRNSARYVQPLTRATTSALESIIGGAERLVARAEPVIASISRGIERTGADIGELFEDMSENADGAAAGIDSLFSTISGLIQVTGPVINGLTAVNEQLGKVGLADGLLGTIGRLNTELSDSGTFARHVAGETVNMGGAMSTASDEANAYFTGLSRVNDELREQEAASRSAYAATTSAAEATASATKAIEENGRGLSLNSEKGRENRTALSNLAEAYLRQYDATVAVNGVGAKSAGVANRNRDAFVALAQKAGYSASKARELASSLGLIPAKKQTAIDASTSSASAKVSAFKKQLGSVPSVRNVTIQVGVSESAKAAAYRKNNANAFSASSYFAAADTSDGYRSRTGGPTPVSVNNNISVSLDGQPFARAITTAVSESERRQAWRQKVGKR
jgi:hypothetical protein